MESILHRLTKRIASEDVVGWVVAFLAMLVVIAFALSFTGRVEWTPLQLASLSGIGTTAVILVIWLQFKSQAKQIELFRKTIEPEITVTASVAFMGMGETLSPPLIIITAANTGNKPVTLSSCGIELENNEMLHFTRSNGLPVRLRVGEAHVLPLTVEELKQSLNGKKPLHAWFGDATGRKYNSKPWHIKEILGIQ